MNRRLYPIVQDGWIYLALLFLVGVIFYLIFPYLALIPAILFLFTAFFFRNPKRVVPEKEDIVLSPADGTVMSVERVYEDKYIKGEAINVKIFLSIFDVHLNRSPVSGIIQYRSYYPGKFLPAFKSHASEVNERNYLGISTGKYRIMVVQVTGFIARRIRCWVDVNDKLKIGQIFGLIKFGSCTELYLPSETEIFVKKGDKVRGGETIIGRLPSEE